MERERSRVGAKMDCERSREGGEKTERERSRVGGDEIGCDNSFLVGGEKMESVRSRRGAVEGREGGTRGWKEGAGLAVRMRCMTAGLDTSLKRTLWVLGGGRSDGEETSLPLRMDLGGERGMSKSGESKTGEGGADKASVEWKEGATESPASYIGCSMAPLSLSLCA